MGMTADLRSSAIIEVGGATKRFGEVTAVDHVSFQVRQGELFGFLGPNGAGKTTTITMLIGLARPDSGTIRIGGLDCRKNPKAAQHLIGVVPDESNLYPELTGFDNLCFCAALYGMGKPERRARAEKLLQDFELSKAAHRRFGGYSKGMKRKLAIAAGIVHKPQVLFLDEPTTGIDVASARNIRQLLADLHHGGTTIFLTTHYIEEAERLCDRIAFIVNGRIVKTDDVSSLLKPVQDRYVTLINGIGLNRQASAFPAACGGVGERITKDPIPYGGDSLQLAAGSFNPSFLGELASCFPGLDFQPYPQDQLRVESSNPILIGPIVKFLEDKGIGVTEARRVQLSLEDVFVQITGIDADAMQKEKMKAAA
jgi:ABC-2 type transport system ATP-binding protein